MSNPTPIIDDLLGLVNVLDAIEAILKFLWRNRWPAIYRIKFGPVSLNEVIAHLGKYGVEAVRFGFNSACMTYMISSRQQRWHDRLVMYRDGVPVLYHPKRAWKK